MLHRECGTLFVIKFPKQYLLFRSKILSCLATVQIAKGDSFLYSGRSVASVIQEPP